MPDLAAPQGELVDPQELTSFAGGREFSSEALTAASAWVRGEAGWHIAPQVTETLVVDSDGGRFLFLPTMHLEQVTGARLVGDADSEGAAVVTPLSGWRAAATPRFRSGVLERAGGWPKGAIEVDVVHGHLSCPADLLPVMVRHIDISAAGRDSVRLGSLSISPSVGSVQQIDDTLARYKIPHRA